MLFLLILTALLSGSSAFTAPHTNPFTASSPSTNAKQTTVLRVLPESVMLGGPEAAQSYFFLWFFGGSGGAGVALRQFPQQLEKFNGLRAMSADGPTEGGETVGISKLCLYPRDICKADLTKVLSNKLSVEKMVENGPKPNYLSTKGYLCYESFAEANKNCNPLTVRAVFDALSTGDIVAPDAAQLKLDAFSDDQSSDSAVFKSELLKTKLAGFSSIAFLLFLLGPIVGSTCLESFALGWFPETLGKWYT